MTHEDQDGVEAAARGGMLTAAGSLASMVLNFALIVLVTRQFGADGAGVFFGAVALFMIVGTASKLGAETGLVYAVSRARAAGRQDDIAAIIRIALVPALLVSLALGGAMMALAPTLATWFTEPSQATAFAGVVRSIGPFLPAFVCVQVLAGATRGMGSMAATVWTINIGRPLLQIVPMAFVAAAGLELGALGLAWAAPLALTAIAAYRWLDVLLSRGDVPRVVLGRRSGLRRGFWRFSAPRGVADTLLMTQNRVGVLIVGALSTAVVTGVFVAIARIIGAVQLFTGAIGQALNPQIAAQLERGDRAGANSLLQQITAWTVLPLAPSLVLLAAFPQAVLSVFGPEFTSGATALRILVGALSVSVVLAHLDNVLLMGGRSRTSLVNVVVSLALTVGLLFTLVPDHGLDGAAWAWAGGMVLYRLLPLAQVWRQLSIQPFGIELARIGVATVPSAVAAALGVALLGDSLGPAFVVGLVVTGAYVVMIWRDADLIGLKQLRGYLT